MKSLIVLFLILGIVTVQAEEMHLIFVNGMAEKTIDPNQAIIHIESWSKASTSKKAQELQASQYSKLKNIFEKFNIKKDDIQTEAFNVYPEMVYDQKLQTNKVTGYRVSHGVQLTSNNIEEVGDLLDALVVNKGEASGVNVNGINWDSDKKADAEASVLQDSVKNARKHAEQLAAAAGVSIKAVHKIQHTSYSSPPVSEPLFEKASFAAAPSMAAPATQLSTGTIKVRVEVQMEFEI